MLEKMKCPRCGAEMNHHADKLLADSELSSKSGFGSTVMERHSCPACGSSVSRCVQSAFRR